MSQKSKKILSTALILLLGCAMLFVYTTFGQQPVAGSKAITIEVVGQDQNSTLYELNTDARFLRQAMEEAEGLEFSGEEGPFGIMIQTVNGDTAIYEQNNAYWSFLVNGEYCNYGIDQQPVEDGDVFLIAYTPV